MRPAPYPEGACQVASTSKRTSQPLTSLICSTFLASLEEHGWASWSSDWSRLWRNRQLL